MTVSKTWPALGKLKPGQQVMVRRSMNDRRGRTPEDQYIPAVVTKVGRVWAEMERSGGGFLYRWRMRMDTQDQGTPYSGSNANFLTMEQHAWRETLDRALAVLRLNGITLQYESVWIGREVELANLIAGYEEKDGGS